MTASFNVVFAATFGSGITLSMTCPGLLHVAAGYKAVLHDPSDKDNHQGKSHYDYKLTTIDLVQMREFNYYVFLVRKIVQV